MSIQRIIGFILWGMAALVILVERNNNLSEVLPPAIVFLIIGLILILKKPKTKEDKQKIKENKLALKNYNETHITTKHQSGLPLAIGTICDVGFNDDNFSFYGGGNNFNLSINKITDICLKTDAEIHKQYVSSIGGAVAGAAVFGPLGAIVGGRAKEKKSTTITTYLIITYLKEGQIDYISFELVDGSNLAQKWINNFNQNKKTTQGETIVL